MRWMLILVLCFSIGSCAKVEKTPEREHVENIVLRIGKIAEAVDLQLKQSQALLNESQKQIDEQGQILREQKRQTMEAAKMLDEKKRQIQEADVILKQQKWLIDNSQPNK